MHAPRLIPIYRPHTIHAATSHHDAGAGCKPNPFGANYASFFGDKKIPHENMALPKLIPTVAQARECTATQRRATLLCAERARPLMRDQSEKQTRRNATLVCLHPTPLCPPLTPPLRSPAAQLFASKVAADAEARRQGRYLVAMPYFLCAQVLHSAPTHFVCRCPSL